MAKKKRKGGRPSKYETEWKDKLILIEGWARDGLVDEQIAEKIGIHPSTLYDWKKKYPEFSEALKKGKEVVDREVENALLKTALGYEYVEEQAFKVKRVYYEDGKRFEEEEIATAPVIRHQPGHHTAQIFWLKNRKPEQWRDRQEIDQNINANVETTINNNIDLSKLSMEELKQLEAIIRKTSDNTAD